MKTHLLRVALFTFAAATCAFAEQETPTPDHDHADSKMKDALNAQLLQDAKNITAAPASVPAPPAFAKTEAAAAASQPKSAPDPQAEEQPAAEATKDNDTLLLPKVQVQNTKITDLDLQLRDQEKQIAREQANTKASEVDKALNGPGISKALTILGGRSSEERETTASERVSLLEDERDIIEQMKLTKDPVRKTELKKQLDDIRKFRRELEKPIQ